MSTSQPASMYDMMTAVSMIKTQLRSLIDLHSRICIAASVRGINNDGQGLYNTSSDQLNTIVSGVISAALIEAKDNILKIFPGSEFYSIAKAYDNIVYNPWTMYKIITVGDHCQVLL